MTCTQGFHAIGKFSSYLYPLTVCPYKRLTSTSKNSGEYAYVDNCLDGGAGCTGDSATTGCRLCSIYGGGQYPNWFPECPPCICDVFGIVDENSICKGPSAEDADRVAARDAREAARESDAAPVAASAAGPATGPAAAPSPEESDETPAPEENDDTPSSPEVPEETEEEHEAEEEEAPITETPASPDGSDLPPTIDPFPATCSFSGSQYNPATDTCGSGTHISQLTKVDLGHGYWAYANAGGHKLIPIEEGGSAGSTVSSGSSLATILGACTDKDNCRAIATDERQTSWMKTSECMSPCFRTYGNWYMAFSDKSPGPFNPDRAETEEEHEAEEEEAPISETPASPDGSDLPPTIDPFPATCSFSGSQYNPATDTCGSGTHISQLTKVDLGHGYWAYANAGGHKLIPIEEGGSAGSTVSSGSSLATILGACTDKDNCRAIATDERQTSWMKTSECMSPCFRTYGNWYMAFSDKSPGPFNPDRPTPVRPADVCPSLASDPTGASTAASTITDACLQATWKEAGCTELGTVYPRDGYSSGVNGPNWWTQDDGARTYAGIKSDMQSYFTNPERKHLCFGYPDVTTDCPFLAHDLTDESVSASDVGLACLRATWQSMGCTVSGTTWPQNTGGWWNDDNGAGTYAGIKADMRVYTNPDRETACYGPAAIDTEMTKSEFTGCSGRNELGVKSNEVTAYECVTQCAANPECVSVEMKVDSAGSPPELYPHSTQKVALCYSSTSCTNHKAEHEPRAYEGYTMFYRTPTSNLAGYHVNHKINNSCQNRNEIALYNGDRAVTLAQCAAACDADDECVSIEIREETPENVDPESSMLLGTCNLSKTCDRVQAAKEATDNEPWYLYLKA